MRNIFTGLLIVFAQLGTSQEILVWSDEFDGSTLNLNNWSYQLGNGCPNLCGWGNNELQSYTSSNNNIKVLDGNLVITAINSNNNWTSARIRSLDKFDFCLGRVEVRAKIPEGRGFWPAAWFLPSEYYYGIWPISGEIDLLETRGQEPEKTLGTIHFGPLFPNNQYTGGEYTDPSGTFADDFHVFEIIWTEESIVWKVDGVQFLEKSREDVGPFRWPFDRNFHALLNFAVGGNFLGNPDATTPTQADFVVDYIRVYQDPENVIISGPEAILRGNDRHVFYTQDIPGYSINWSIPDDAQIINGIGNEIEVIWGFSSGYVEAELFNESESITIQKWVQVLPDSCSEVFDNREDFRRIYWVGGDGYYEAFTLNPSPDETNSSSTVTSYNRNPGAQYDIIQLSNDIIKDASDFESETKNLQLKVYSTAPIGTEVQISLENRGLISQPYPTGRRTLLNTFTTKQNEWETLTFEYVLTPDGGLPADEIDQLTVLFAPNSFTNYLFYLDDWAVKENPCLVLNNSNNSFNQDFELKLFPNPFSSKVNIVINSNAEYLLYDSFGRLVYQGNEADDFEDFTLKLAPAVYFLNIRNSNVNIYRKLIKQ